jgi:hypothetical protein
MSQADTVTLFINEAAASATAGDLEKNIGEIPGVHAVELGTPHGVRRRAADGPPSGDCV